jgi:hypothetical protein
MIAGPTWVLNRRAFAAAIGAARASRVICRLNHLAPTG